MIEPDQNVREALVTLLEGNGWDVVPLAQATGLKQALREVRTQAVISESSLPGEPATAVLVECEARQVPVIFTGHRLQIDVAVDLVRRGAFDYLEKPFAVKRLLDLLSTLPKRQNRQATH